MPLFPTAPVRLQPYFGHRNETHLYMKARALRSAKSSFDGGGRWQAMRTMLAQFLSHEVAGMEARLEVERADGSSIEVPGTTDKEGFVTFEIALDDPLPLPENTSWEVVTLHWTNENGEQCIEGHVLAPGRSASLAVISDIDDTIIETGITGNLRSVARNWRRVLAQMPDERLAVPGADVFYSSLGGGRVLAEGETHTGDRIRAFHRPFFYVSSSPWNLFSYLVAFKRQREMPLGPVFLRDWGLDRSTFGSSSHGSHKTDAIRRILADYPSLRFAMIGDDTQGDLTAFGEIVQEHANRIAAVFIRKAAGPFSPEEVAAKAAIEEAGVPLWLGESYDLGQDFLKNAGLSADGATSKIIEAVEKGDEAA
ncbi:phosphatase domain-containing protein [Altererythrobacter sp. MTPC7]|uniref:phosphatase domain-containing protein n=1 Tax=Altererythrobacter sp. MTPC7 TaxID=3056567 RepID=UPI0036F4192B